MAKLGELSRRVMAGCTSLYTDETGCEAVEERRNLRPALGPVEGTLAIFRDAVHVTDVLGHVRANSGHVRGAAPWRIATPGRGSHTPHLLLLSAPACLGHRLVQLAWGYNSISLWSSAIQKLEHVLQPDRP